MTPLLNNLRALTGLRLNLKSIAFVLLFCFNIAGVKAQQGQPAITYRNGFWNTYHTNPDSALFYARKLVKQANYEPFLREALHQDLFSFFLDATKEKMKAKVGKDQLIAWETDFNSLQSFHYKTIVKLHDSKINELVYNVEPLYHFASIQQNLKDSVQVEDFTRSFITSFKTQKNLYQNSSATYGLFIYRMLEKDKRFTQVANELLTTLVTVLATSQSSERVDGYTQKLRERAWFRCVYSCANYFKANQLIKTGSEQDALTYLKTATEYSPDLTDMNNYRGYYIDAMYLPEAVPNRVYTMYINQLKKNPSNYDEVLRVLSQVAFRNPIGFKEQLKSFYNQYYVANGDFATFWQKQLNSNLVKAPAFKIKGLDGKKYTSEAVAGKWKLVDFWGTWCRPCREEHPTLEKMYTGKAGSFFDKVELITIACLDEEEKVSNYQKLFQYTFPVAMSDLKIEKQFNVTTYPTKILISPEGNALTIPFGMDWVNYIKLYVSN